MAKTAKQFEAETQAAVIAEDSVTVRITKMGEGKVSTGKHEGGLGDELYEKGETAILPRSVAEELEVRGYAEIQDGPSAEELAAAEKAAQAAQAKNEADAKAAAEKAAKA